MDDNEKVLQQQLRALNLPRNSPEGQAFTAMEPDLRRELANRLLVPGTKAASAAISEFNKNKQAGAKSKEDDAALTARIDKMLAEQPPEFRQRVIGMRDPEKIGQAARDFAAEKQAQGIQTGAITAGSTAAGFGAGLLGGKLSDKMSNAAVKREMTARSGTISDAARQAREVSQTLPEDALRASYGDVSKGVRTGKVVPYGALGTGLGMLGFGAYSTFHRAPEAKSDTERAVWTGTGYGEMGAGGKMLNDTLRRYHNPEQAYPQGDVAAVNAARRMAGGGVIAPVPGAPQPEAPEGGGGGGGGPDPHQARVDTLTQTMTREELRDRARKMKLPISGTKAEIAGRIAGKLPSVLGPVAIAGAGLTAFDAANNRAKAEGLSTGEAAGKGFESGAIAGGTTAGTMYGGQKLAEYGARKLATSAAGRVALRAIPYAGWGLAAHDAYNALPSASEQSVMDNPRDILPGGPPRVTGNPRDLFPPSKAETENNLRLAREDQQRQIAEHFRAQQAPLGVPMPARPQPQPQADPNALARLLAGSGYQ